MGHNPEFLRLVAEARLRVRTCTVQEVKARLDSGDQFQFLDVREDSEFAGGHILGATHLGKGILERDIESIIPNPQTPIVLYCGGGYRSVLAADALREMGYTDVVSMDGGIRAWREARYPLSHNTT